MQTKPSVASPFIRQRLPWIVGAVALVIYLVTVNRWVRLESLPTVARVAGWDWTPTVQAPLHFLLTLPFRWLSPSVLPLALNTLSAVLAAVTLAVLTRCLTLLPFDRTREARVRERSEHAYLTIPLAWLPVVFAVIACGLQLTFWEHATAGTGEMLDALLFVWLIRCLLEFRVSRREGWLVQFAVLYGAAITNNYAMIAFFPGFLVALIWILGLEFFRLRFLLRMTLFGLAGLAGYLVLPLAGVLRGVGDLTFGEYLKNSLAMQWQSLLGFPRFVILLLGLQSLVPVAILGIRSTRNPADTSAAGAAVTGGLVSVVHFILLAVCLSAFLDLHWGPRQMGLGAALLPFYLLAAIGVAYYAGYLLLIVRPPVARAWRKPTSRSALISQAVATLIVLAASGTALYLIYKNVRVLRENDGRTLAQMAESMTQGLPENGAILISDTPTELLLAEAALHRRQSSHPHVLLRSSLLSYHAYHDQLAKRYPGRWPALAAPARLPEPLPPAFLSSELVDLAQTNRVFYLHPSLGFFHEVFARQPRGLIFDMVPLPADPEASIPADPAGFSQNVAFWEALRSTLDRLGSAKHEINPERQYLRVSYARALTYWGVSLQRAQRLTEAATWFRLALKLNPDSDQARLNLDFNGELADAQKSGQPLPPPDFGQLPPLRSGYKTWDDLLLMNGPFDNPPFTAQIGLVLSAGGNYRQATIEFQRLHDLFPTNQAVALRLGYVQSMARIAAGDSDGAERGLRKLAEAHGNQALIHQALSQVYLLREDYARALPEVEQQLQLLPNDRAALLNLAKITIALKSYDRAVAAMNQLLEQDPKIPPALLNRAIACLQLGRLDDAERDYSALLKELPKSHVVHYGLGEVAFRRQDAAAALRHWSRYLEFAPKDTTEYRTVAARVQELKAGRAGS